MRRRGGWREHADIGCVGIVRYFRVDRWYIGVRIVLFIAVIVCDGIQCSSIGLSRG